ncbi:hydrogenase maturation nickel metallochaperone HypA [Clostridium sp. CF011]|uniref:hydrogenase maturation nickel metallochaperone HypA n=1 Tax=unclassified Clostridium TaxID=2614128 RepID=UPI001C0DAB42|nr:MULTISPECIES: hydrogenase maturation nickel metallochaperone HypA [unclassified Clostridium]MBU3091205.1 hydrogenase maturation nickel metallochaperone HypA [Clostridium sp. CF011]MBW9146509.1 hydrogenase maturation nickel metallochaperone HypA [Clostridium sp. CM027]UVE39609.1 hydrogenase maturation nickel metallochaperone HypA [Clostridium sp. CM027]WAG68515.1 hydrogenase maturation nickel metallochaperone HypA [Clostridium sp. CF011]
MHEVSIIQNVIKIVTDKAIENKLTKVNKVSLKIGELSGVMPECLNFAFEICIMDTMLEGSILEIEKVNAVAECKDCKQKFLIDHFNKLCPCCNKFCSSIISGYELYVNTIEGD